MSLFPIVVIAALLLTQPPTAGAGTTSPSLAKNLKMLDSVNDRIARNQIDAETAAGSGSDYDAALQLIFQSTDECYKERARLMSKIHQELLDTADTPKGVVDKPKQKLEPRENVEQGLHNLDNEIASIQASIGALPEGSTNPPLIYWQDRLAAAIQRREDFLAEHEDALLPPELNNAQLDIEFSFAPDQVTEVINDINAQDSNINPMTATPELERVFELIADATQKHLSSSAAANTAFAAFQASENEFRAFHAQHGNHKGTNKIPKDILFECQYKYYSPTKHAENEVYKLVEERNAFERHLRSLERALNNFLHSGFPHPDIKFKWDYSGPIPTSRVVSKEEPAKVTPDNWFNVDTTPAIDAELLAQDKVKRVIAESMATIEQHNHRSQELTYEIEEQLNNPTDVSSNASAHLDRLLEDVQYYANAISILHREITMFTSARIGSEQRLAVLLGAGILVQTSKSLK